MGGWIAFMVVSLCCSLFSMMGLASNLYEKLGHIKDQKIATRCDIEIATAELREKTCGGYFFKDGKKIEADILDQTEKEIKISYREVREDGWGFTNEEWMPIKEFHKYYSLREISEILNKTKK